MSAPSGPAAPASGPATPATDDSPDGLDLAELMADPEIAALLEFEPVPRKREVDGGWTPELQREFIARLALLGSPGRACDEMGKTLTGMMKVQRSPLAASFRRAWHGAIELAKRRRAERAQAEYVRPGSRAPSIDHRRRSPSPQPSPFKGEGGEGQVLNEFGEWEDEESYARRGEEARDSIASKLTRIRRLYLKEISGNAGKRAAFEILTEWPVDWDKAAVLEPQVDEPFRQPRMREPDMILTADAGWLGGLARGRDKVAELRRAIDEHREAEGLEPVNWSEADASENRSS